MPCRGDYMEPNPNELAAARALREKFQALADEATADADVLREYVLGNVAAERILGRVNKNLSERYIDLRKQNDNLYNVVKLSDKIMEPVNQTVEEYEIANALVHDKAAGKPIDDEKLESLEQVQIKHREEDLSRLMKTFAASRDRARLRKVLDADSTKPLTAQLGFDPDEF